MRPGQPAAVDAGVLPAVGLALLAAIRRPSWRVPVLAVATLQYGLHSLNHLLDLAKAHPAWLGWFDLLTLAAATAMLAWLWRTADREVHPAGCEGHPAGRESHTAGEESHVGEETLPAGEGAR
ncbi:MAG TPA: hypothetical protein VMG62_00145 [Solirubrobacteraceae bacterium]|nr:hypothetical protein [Solirubrobacteraceae bacterium]